MSKILKSFISNEQALKRYLSRFFGLSQDIDEAAQETFLKAFAAEIKTDIRSPKAFLFRVAKNIALNEIEKKTNNPTHSIEDVGGPDSMFNIKNIDIEEDLENKRKLVLFSKAVAELPPKCRQVFLMRKVDGLQMKEIAKKLNISVSGVEKHVVTGLVKCSDYFRKQGYDPAELGPLAVQYSKHHKGNIVTLARTDEERS